MKRSRYRKNDASDCYIYTEEEVKLFSEGHIVLYPKVQNWEIKIDLTKKKHCNILDLEAMGPFKYMVTVTFQKLVGKKEALKLASVLQIRANRNLSKYLGIEPIFMNGVAVIEEACILPSDNTKPDAFVRAAKAKFDKNYHFHILIKDILCEDQDALISLIKKAYWMAARNLKLSDNKTMAISKSGGVHVRGVSSDLGGASYCMEDSGTVKWEWQESVFYLSEEGLC